MQCQRGYVTLIEPSETFHEMQPSFLISSDSVMFVNTEKAQVQSGMRSGYSKAGQSYQSSLNVQVCGIWQPT